MAGVTSAQESFYVSVDLAYVPHLEVEVQPGYNLFRLSKACGTTIDQIRINNALVDNDIQINTILHIPIDPALINQNKNDLNTPIPVYFKISRGTTFYALERALGISNKQIQAVNKSEHIALKEGNKLLTGWIDWSLFAMEPTEQSEQLIRPTALSPSSIEQLDINAVSIYESETLVNKDPPMIIDTLVSRTPVTVKEKGIAYCEKSSTDYKALIAMHKDAPVNSSISIYNPMLDRSVEAKVVGELPREAYPEGVTVVISPSVAEALGALDRRFYVEITYQD